ncbi:MAG: hypothetical protein WA373_09565 [Burkholderiales bacterium]
MFAVSGHCPIAHYLRSTSSMVDADQIDVRTEQVQETVDFSRARRARRSETIAPRAACLRSSGNFTGQSTPPL